MGYMLETRNKRIAKEYQIAATTSASSAQLLSFPKTQNDILNNVKQVIIAAKGADITFKFGNSSSVAASSTVTSNALADNNFTLLTGAIYALELNNDQNYVSVVTASGSGTAIIQLTTISA